MVASTNKLAVLCWVDFTATYFDPAPPATLYTRWYLFHTTDCHNYCRDWDCIVNIDCLDCLDGHNGEDEDEQISITTEDPFNDDKDQSELQEEETEIDQLKNEVFISQFD